MTKAQEMKTLEQIKALIESTGKDSYISWAFAGCVEMARRNIENDWAENPEEAVQAARKETDRVRQELSRVQERANLDRRFAEEKAKAQEANIAALQEELEAMRIHQRGLENLIREADDFKAKIKAMVA